MSRKEISQLAETLANQLAPMRDTPQSPDFLPDLLENLERLRAGHGSSHQDNHSST